MSASIWNQGEVPILDPQDSIEVQRFLATAGQVLFTITAFKYQLAANALLVFKNGLALIRGVDYTETSTTTFTLTLPATLNDVIFVVGFVQIDNASEQATEAAALAVATALALNKLYLGSKATAPTLDNQGQPLLDGALYFNTTANILYVYDLGTTTWVSGVVVPGGTLLSANNLSDVGSLVTTRNNLGVRQVAAQVVFNSQLVSKVSVADALAVTTSKITANMQSKVGDTLGDELEMDAFVVTGRCLVNGTIIFTARCVSGFAQGTYNFNYSIQN